MNPRSPHLRRVQSARTTLLLDQPFFGVLALQLQLLDDPACQTAWTNGSSVAFSPAFVDTLSQDELIAVLAHEVMHCACGHQWRRDSREPKRWNVAADYAINGLLKEAGFRLPASALLDSQYHGRSAEWIYDRLPHGTDSEQGTGTGQGNSQSSGEPEPEPGTGEVRDAPADSTQSEADWQQVTKQAAKIAAGQGRLPASMRRDLDQLTAPRVDWRSTLRRYVQEVTRADYSWSRPNVRYLAAGLFLPALHAIACGPIVVAVDTSGSIDAVLLTQFGAEIQTIADELQPSRITVMYCDADVQRTDTFERGDIVTLAAEGGGGTDFRPVFAAVDASGDIPAVLVYLTDLDGTFPEQAPDYPVVWCKAGGYRSSVPFGDLVDCEAS